MLEALAGAYLTLRARLLPQPVEAEVYSAQDGLESCRKSMELRELEYLEEARKLGAAALAAKRAGNRVLARTKVLERRRVAKRLDKLRSGLSLVDAQIEAIRMSELDREIMESLRASTSAMKKAGIGAAIKDAEQLLGEMDDQLKDTHDLTSVLAGPRGPVEDEDSEVDLELEWLEPLEDAGQVFVRTPQPAILTPMPPIQEHEPAPAPIREHEPAPAPAQEPEASELASELALAPEAEAGAGGRGDQLAYQ